MIPTAQTLSRTAVAVAVVGVDVDAVAAMQLWRLMSSYIRGGYRDWMSHLKSHWTSDSEIAAGGTEEQRWLRQAWLVRLFF